MKIGLLQMDVAWHRKEVNFARAEYLAEKARSEGCDLIVLPEMFSTGYSMDLAVVAEEEDGDTAHFLSGLAKKTGLNIIAGFAVRTSGGPRGKNMAVAYGRPGAVIGRYEKMRPFSLAGEGRFYEAGREAVTFAVDGIPFSVFICYDLRFPELFRRVAREVTAICVIANWPASRQDHWETLLRARAIEDQCYIIGVNRTGTDGNSLVYEGGSLIIGPSGETICAAGAAEGLTYGEIDPGLVDEVRSQFPFLLDMRDVVGTDRAGTILAE
jgi:omega-amidase